MTNRQKAEEIALKNSKEYLVSRNNSHQRDILFKENSIVECEKCAMEMAEWKEQQMIEKAVEWIKSQMIPHGTSPLAIFNYIEEFKQAVKGE